MTVCEGNPEQLTFPRPPARAPWKQQALFPKRPDSGTGTPHASEGPKQQMNALLYLAVRIQNHCSVGVIHQPDRQSDGQFAAAGFVQHSAAHAGLDHMKFCF